MKPCPFCGASEEELDVVRLDMVDPDTFQVYCSRCDTYGPTAPSLPTDEAQKEAAIAKWNERVA